MRYILFLLVLISGCVKSQPIKVAGVRPTTNNQPVLIIFYGESNSGGAAVYSPATTTELSVRSLKIFNNYSSTFQGLLIGTNNLLLHTGFVDNTTSGMEIGLANKYDSGSFSGHPVYLLKAGQGGSKISDWVAATTPHYYDTLTARFTLAVNSIISATGMVPKIFVWWSLGINDIIAGTSASTWKSNVETHFGNIRSSLCTIIGATVTIPILMTRFDSMSGNLAYETVLGDIDTDVSDCYAISTTGATLQDANHWDYYGFRNVIVPAFVTITISYL